MQIVNIHDAKTHFSHLVDAPYPTVSRTVRL